MIFLSRLPWAKRASNILMKVAVDLYNDCNMTARYKQRHSTNLQG